MNIVIISIVRYDEEDWDYVNDWDLGKIESEDRECNDDSDEKARDDSDECDADLAIGKRKMMMIGRRTMMVSIMKNDDFI